MHSIDKRVTLIGGGIGCGLGALLAIGLTLTELELAIDGPSGPSHLYFLVVYSLLVAVPLATLGLVIGAVASSFSRTPTVQWLIGAIGSLVAVALMYLTLVLALS